MLRSVFVDFRGSWSLTSPGAPLPDSPDPFALLTAPFAFQGTLIGSREGPDLFEASLTGSGPVRVSIARTGPGGWQIDEAAAIQYLFSGAEPVPEPGTLLLIGSGLTGLTLRRLRSFRLYVASGFSRKLEAPLIRPMGHQIDGNTAIFRKVADPETLFVDGAGSGSTSGRLAAAIGFLAYT